MATAEVSDDFFLTTTPTACGAAEVAQLEYLSLELGAWGQLGAVKRAFLGRWPPLARDREAR